MVFIAAKKTFFSGQKMTLLCEDCNERDKLNISLPVIKPTVINVLGCIFTLDNLRLDKNLMKSQREMALNAFRISLTGWCSMFNAWER